MSMSRREEVEYTATIFSELSLEDKVEVIFESLNKCRYPHPHLLDIIESFRLNKEELKNG